MSACPGSPSPGYVYFSKNVSLAISKYYNDSLTAMGQGGCQVAAKYHVIC